MAQRLVPKFQPSTTRWPACNVLMDSFYSLTQRWALTAVSGQPKNYYRIERQGCAEDINERTLSKSSKALRRRGFANATRGGLAQQAPVQFREPNCQFSKKLPSLTSASTFDLTTVRYQRTNKPDPDLRNSWALISTRNLTGEGILLFCSAGTPANSRLWTSSFLAMQHPVYPRSPNDWELC